MYTFTYIHKGSLFSGLGIMVVGAQPTRETLQSRSLW